MLKERLDEMVEYAASCLLFGDSAKVGMMAREIATKWPDEPARSILFSITSAAAGIEETFCSGASKRMVQFGYKMTAIIAADIFAVECIGRKIVKCEDLINYWEHTEPYYYEDTK